MDFSFWKNNAKNQNTVAAESVGSNDIPPSKYYFSHFISMTQNKQY